MAEKERTVCGVRSGGNKTVGWEAASTKRNAALQPQCQPMRGQEKGRKHSRAEESYYIGAVCRV